MKTHSWCGYGHVLVVVAVLGGCDGKPDVQPPRDSDVLEVLEAVPLEMPSNLRLRRSFDYSTYFGVLRSQGELDRLWDQLRIVEGGIAGAIGIGRSSAPSVDFSRTQVLWFGDYGARASFVDSLTLAYTVLQDTVLATVHVFHSDFGSRHLRLWRMPSTHQPVHFVVLHEYERRGP